MSRGILERMASGDPAAVPECLGQYGGLVWSLARRLSASHADAEDAVQEIFVDVWRHAARFDARVAGEATFITMIARRRLIDRQRKLGRMPALAPLDSEPATLTDSPDRTALADEAARAREQMKHLKPVERQVLEMAIDRGLSQAEIARLLDLPLGTVKSHARRGLLQLRERLVGSPVGPAEGGVP